MPSTCDGVLAVIVTWSRGAADAGGVGMPTTTIAAATIAPTTRRDKDVIRFMQPSVRERQTIRSGRPCAGCPFEGGYRRVTSSGRGERWGRNTYPESGTGSGWIAPSTSSASRCSVARCASWMCAVTSDGIRIATSASGASFPPDRPVSARTMRHAPSGLPEHGLRGVAARGDAEQDVPGPSERLELPREDAVDTEVVPDRREDRRVRRQGDRAHRGSRMIDRQGADELRREVLCIGRAPAVPTDQQRAAVPERGGQAGGGLDDVVQARRHDRLQDRGGLRQVPGRASARLFAVHITFLAGGASR